MDRLISEKSLLDKIDEWKGFDTVTIRLSTLRDIVKAIPSAEPCEDAISRQALQEWIKDKSFGDIVVASEHNFDCLPPVKPQLCEDAISRQAVDELSKELIHTTRDKADFLCNFWEGLQKLPPVKPQEPKWIPVSKRLPKWDIECLVVDDKGEFGVGFYRDDVGAWDSPSWGWLERKDEVDNHDAYYMPCGIGKVIAWIPLPPCYKPEESEDNK